MSCREALINEWAGVIEAGIEHEATCECSKDARCDEWKELMRRAKDLNERVNNS